MKHPIALKNEALEEAYAYFDKHVRKLSRTKEEKINPAASGLEDNDVDAFRHAYVSGVFTQDYSEEAAEILGQLNELSPESTYSNSTKPGAKNMDLWNNHIGRKYGSKTKTRKHLLKRIHSALKNGELITAPSDPRKYVDSGKNRVAASKPVIVLSQSKTGRNQIFFDRRTEIMMTLQDFVARIESGEYPNYAVKEIKGLPTPVSNPDGRPRNNLG